MVIYRNFNKARFGNQLFFVASTIGIALKNKTQYGFASNMGYNGVDYQKIFKNELPITNLEPKKIHHQKKFSYYDIKITEDTELEGYFQSEKFFSDYEHEVREQLKFKEEIIEIVKNKYPEITESTSIHIRRGDYLNQTDYHPVLPLNYYETIINDHLEIDKKIFVFSDDESWCRNKFNSSKFIFPNFINDNDLLSFVLMSMSKEIVISNSTYSWWAAWLNDQKDKKIFSPHHSMWFGKNYSNLDNSTIIPENWIQIKV
jgi:hypothetical protein